MIVVVVDDVVDEYCIVVAIAFVVALAPAFVVVDVVPSHRC